MDFQVQLERAGGSAGAKGGGEAGIGFHLRCPRSEMQ